VAFIEHKIHLTCRLKAQVKHLSLVEDLFCKQTAYWLYTGFILFLFFLELMVQKSFDLYTRQLNWTRQTER